MLDFDALLGLIEGGRTYFGARYTSLRSSDYLPQMLARSHEWAHKSSTVGEKVTVQSSIRP
jgi:hypothetical protein